MGIKKKGGGEDGRRRRERWNMRSVQLLVAEIVQLVEHLTSLNPGLVRYIFSHPVTFGAVDQSLSLYR